MRFKQEYFDTFASFFDKYSNHYFLIGGFATAAHFARYGLEFRATKDFDVVLVANLDGDEGFAKQIEKLIQSGGYENHYTNGKKTAYRFESPKSSAFPKILEFFVGEGELPNSLHHHLTKMTLEVNEDKLSAIVLDRSLYEYAKGRIISFRGVPILDALGLIVLKCLAYFKNLELYRNGAVKKNDYLKHRKDVFQLLTVIEGEGFQGIPEPLLGYLEEFLPVLESATDLAKMFGVPLGEVTARYKELCLPPKGSAQ